MERSQTPDHYVISSVLNTTALSLKAASGATIVLSRDDSADDVFAKLKLAVPSMKPINSALLNRFDDGGGSWVAWHQLLYDLGSTEKEMLVFDQGLRFRRIDRFANYARISIGDDKLIGEFQFTLDRGRLAGLPVDLADMFVSRNPIMQFNEQGQEGIA